MPKQNKEQREFVERTIREKVFVESCRILKRDGWGGFTMEKLAERVGVAKGTLYNYFTDKLDVIAFVNERHFNEIAEDVESMVTAKGDCRQILRGCLRRGLVKMREFRFLHMVMAEMRMKSSVSARAGGVGRDPGNKVRGAMLRFFSRGIEEGVFKPLPPELIELFFTAVFDGVEVRATSDPDFNPEAGETFERMMDMIIDGISVHDGDAR